VEEDKKTKNKYTANDNVTFNLRTLTDSSEHVHIIPSFVHSTYQFSTAITTLEMSCTCYDPCL